MKEIIRYKGKKAGINVRRLGKLGMASGLMFKSSDCDNLLFDFKKEGRYAIHSFFVFFPFLAIYLDSENKVTEIRAVKPFSLAIKPKKMHRKLIEIPCNSKNAKIIHFLVGKRETFKYTGD